MERGLGGAMAVAAAAALFVAACGKAPPPPAAPPPGPPAQAAAPAPKADAALLERGSALYAKHCADCHGDSGRGDGPLAVYLLPRPRDFVAARYRITSTWQNKPTDDDLLGTLRRGFPGTPMPSFGHLPEADLLALVAKVKSFAERPIETGVDPSKSDPTGPIPVPPEPKDGPESVAKGKELYAKGCAACHGPTGRGDGPQEQHDDRGLAVWPRNFAAGEWKGGGAVRDFYIRIVGGLSGSPMPASANYAGDDGWHLARFVRSQADPALDARNEQKRQTLRVARAAGGAPLDPADPAWGKSRESWVALMPLWARKSARVPGVKVAALHDGKSLALRLSWEDATRDESTFGQEEFRDAVAVQVSSAADPPFFGMGAKDGPVRLWMWKADRQADAARKGDLETRFPNMAGDGYPTGGKPLEQVVPNAALAAHDGLYLAGKAAGNPVSDFGGKSPAESLKARGPGTLEFCKAGPPVEARGDRTADGWAVVLRRSLADPDPEGVSFRPGGRASAGFALWNGSDGDRNGTKSVTVWHELVLEE